MIVDNPSRLGVTRSQAQLAGAGLRRRFDEIVVTRAYASSACLSIERGDLSQHPIAFVYAVDDVVVSTDGRLATRLPRGDFMALKRDGAFRSDTPGELGCILVVLIPSAALLTHRRVGDVRDRQTWSTRSGTSRLLAKMFDGLAVELERYEERSPGTLGRHIVGLLSLVLGESPAAAPRPSLLHQSKEFIDAHLAEVDLTPGQVASALNVSTRTLHRWFEDSDLTIRGWIRERRLENCRRDLMDHSLDGLPVSSIAARWGLWDAAHFSRIFKAAYGMSPTEYRAASHPALESVSRSVDRERVVAGV